MARPALARRPTSQANQRGWWSGTIRGSLPGFVAGIRSSTSCCAHIRLRRTRLPSLPYVRSFRIPMDGVNRYFYYRVESRGEGFAAKLERLRLRSRSRGREGAASSRALPQKVPSRGAGGKPATSTGHTASVAYLGADNPPYQASHVRSVRIENVSRARQKKRVAASTKTPRTSNLHHARLRTAQHLNHGARCNNFFPPDSNVQSLFTESSQYPSVRTAVVHTDNAVALFRNEQGADERAEHIHEVDPVERHPRASSATQKGREIARPHRAVPMKAGHAKRARNKLEGRGGGGGGKVLAGGAEGARDVRLHSAQRAPSPNPAVGPGVGPLRRVRRQRGSVREALHHRVEEARVAQVVQPRAHLMGRTPPPATHPAALSHASHVMVGDELRAGRGSGRSGRETGAWFMLLRRVARAGRAYTLEAPDSSHPQS